MGTSDDRFTHPAFPGITAGVVAVTILACALPLGAAPPARSSSSPLGSPFSGADHWWDGFAGTMVNGEVECAISHDGSWYVGGTFTGAGGVGETQGLARWAGSQWSSPGVPGVSLVEALAVYQDDLYAGGLILTSGGAPSNGVVKWDGSSWGAVGTGTDGIVHALGLHGTDLIVGGEFTQAGGVPASNVARWNGTSWSALGSGLSGPIYAIAEYQGQIFAGGSFAMGGGLENLALWTGSSWEKVGGSIEGGDVLALAVYQGELIAGGTFTSAGSGNGPSFVARWNGSSWEELGGGVSGWVGALIVHDGKLYLGGGFNQVGTVPASRVACWDGSTWSALDSGVTGGTVNALASDGLSVLVGGDFDFAGAEESVNLARWDGVSWDGTMSSPGNGLGGDGNVLYPDAGTLVVGGAFSSAGGQAASRIVRWDGTAWSPIGDGFNATVLALETYGGELIAAGNFTHSGGLVRNHVARWDGSAWQPLGTGINGPVHALEVYGGDLYAGGQFTSAGGVPVNNVASWNGTSWSDVGGGVTPQLGNVAQVRALIEHDGVLVVGGAFDYAGGVTRRMVAAWNGTAWASMGSGFWGFSETTMIRDFTTWGGLLVAGGDFTQAGGIFGNRYVSVWNGSGWGSVGNVGTAVACVAVCDSILLAGAGSDVHYWNGAEWDTLGGGMSSWVNDLAVYQNDLLVTGSFSAAGSTPSLHMAKWGMEQVGIIDVRPILPMHAFPNPFRASTTVAFELEEPGEVELAIFDVGGRRRAVLATGYHRAGFHETPWRGVDEAGRPLPAGQYYLLLETPGGRATRKLTRIR